MNNHELFTRFVFFVWWWNWFKQVHLLLKVLQQIQMVQLLHATAMQELKQYFFIQFIQLSYKKGLWDFYRLMFCILIPFTILNSMNSMNQVSNDHNLNFDSKLLSPVPTHSTAKPRTRFPSTFLNPTQLNTVEFAQLKGLIQTFSCSQTQLCMPRTLWRRPKVIAIIKLSHFKSSLLQLSSW